jgi:predicted ATPase
MSSNDDKLFFKTEKFVVNDPEHFDAELINLGEHQKESGLSIDPDTLQATIREFIWLFSYFNKCNVFQFHDTTSEGAIRKPAYVEDYEQLHEDGSNLASVLYFLNENFPKYYKRIARRINQVFPQFDRFDLKPAATNIDYVKLNWFEKSRKNFLFGPQHLSDGTLRFIALATLLLQPPERLPNFIVIDEPELGLHPSAISVLASMIKEAAVHTQIVLATQSPRLVDEFDTDDIIVAERIENENRTTFKKLDSQKLADWLENYSLSELWEKNVLGGQP